MTVTGDVRAAVGAGLALLLLGASGARAETCPAMAGAEPGLATLPAETRIAFIRARLDAERPRAQTWRRSFTIGYTGLTVGQLGYLYATRGSADRATLRLGAVGSSLGIGALYAWPLTVIRDAPRVRSLAAGPEGRCDALTEMEAALLRGAASEARGSGAKAHLGNLALNAAFGLAIGLRYHRWNGAAMMFVTGEIIGETQILTQPTGLVSDLARYRVGDVGGELANRPRLAWAAAPVAAPEGTGLALFLAF